MLGQKLLTFLDCNERAYFERQIKQSMNILFLTLGKFNSITEQGITILPRVNLSGFVKIGVCSEDVNKDASYKL